MVGFLPVVIMLTRDMSVGFVSSVACRYHSAIGGGNWWDA